MRVLNQQQYLSLKAATRKALKECGGLEMAAAETRVGVPTLSDYQNTANMDCFMPIDVLADLTATSKCTAVLDVLAAQSGCILTPLPLISGAPVLSAQLARVLKETGDVVAGAGQALEDQKISLRERTGLIRQVDEALAALVQFRNQIAQEG